VALCLSLWTGKTVDAILYALQFASASGSFVGPLVAASFLVQSSEMSLIHVSEGKGGSEIHIFYGAFGGVCLCVSSAFLALAVLNWKRGADHDIGSEDDSSCPRPSTTDSALLAADGQCGEAWAGLSGRSGAFARIFMCSFFFLYVGGEVGYGSFLPTFGVAAAGASRPHAARLASVRSFPLQF